MELTNTQKRHVENSRLDQSAYAAYDRKMVTRWNTVDAPARERRYCELRLSGLSVDAAYDALVAELKLKSVSNLKAFEAEYNDDEPLADVVARFAPDLA